MIRQVSPASSVEESVYERYRSAANQREEALCCPVQYDPRLLEVIPIEILERDYGCGDPSPYVRPGDCVLDLGSGGGKLCYMAAQLVGASGRVIGVDCNQEMRSLAMKHQQTVAARLGFNNVEFRFGMIQDLRLDLEQLDQELAAQPITRAADWLKLRQLEDRLRSESPMIPEESVDCVVSNCVLNLVRQQDRRQLFQEVFRVLKVGGRAAISDIVCDEDVPEEMQQDGELWSGCLSGAFREDLFLKAFEETGFHGIQLAKHSEEPWQIINGLEFRSVTILAYKGKQGPCLERNQALIYRGPFRSVEDDDGHRFVRGKRVAVCDKTFHLLQRTPYQEAFAPVPPWQEIPVHDAQEFNCRRSALRDPRETKGQDYQLRNEVEESCCNEKEPCS